MSSSGLLDTIQSAAGNDGGESAIVSDLFLIFLLVSAVVYLVVLAFLGIAVLRRRRHGGQGRGLRIGLVAWVFVTALILAGLSVATWLFDRRIAEAAGAPQLEVQVTARQWWWEIRYMDEDPSRIVRTANELHLPAGVPVHVTLRSSDVIHSLWIPNLAGKRDLIPGRVNEIAFEPRREGLYRGQCAEFCGLQHAHMALDVTVESPAEFAAWRARQLQPAAPPATLLTQAGHALVTGRQCASCHSIAGTPASAQIAPDLTHFASRRSIAAGTLPMSRANIAAWIADPQAHKPGSNMPAVPMSREQLRAVTFYLESLR